MTCTQNEQTTNDAITNRGPPMPPRSRETLHWLRDHRTMPGHANDPIWGFWRSSQGTYAPLAPLERKCNRLAAGAQSPRATIWDIFCTRGGKRGREWKRFATRVDDAPLFHTTHLTCPKVQAEAVGSSKLRPNRPPLSGDLERPVRKLGQFAPFPLPFLRLH